MNGIDNIEVSMKDCNGICENSFASYSSNENESRSYETEAVETDLHFESFNNITSSDMHVNMQNDTKIIGLKDNVEKEDDYLEDDSDPLTDYRNSVWKKKSTKLLLTLYKEYKNEFCDYTKKKKYIWQAIAEKLRQEGYFVTADSCDTKWRNMLKTYRKTVKYNEQRNVVPRKCPFFDEIDAVLNEQVANRQIKETLQIKKENYGYLIQKRTGVTWNMESIKYLISAFREHKKDFHDDRIKKRYVWNKIAETMSQKGCVVPPDSCEAKWKNLVRKFKQTLDSNGKPTADTYRSQLYREIIDLVNESYCSYEQVIDVNKNQIISSQWPERRKPVGFIWDLQSTKLLISLYAENKNNTFQKKSKLWTSIAEAMSKKGYSVTPNTCDAKWRKMIKIFKSALQYHKRTGNVPTKCWYFEEMKELCGILSVNTKCVKHLKNFHNRKKLQKNSVNKPSIKIQESNDIKKIDIISWLDNRKEEQDRHEKEKIEVLMNMHKERMELMGALIQVLKN